jgi:hypothetical protein
MGWFRKGKVLHVTQHMVPLHQWTRITTLCGRTGLFWRVLPQELVGVHWCKTCRAAITLKDRRWP